MDTMHFIDKKTVLLKLTNERDILLYSMSCVLVFLRRLNCGSSPPMSYPLVIFHLWSLLPLGERFNG